MIKGIGNLLFSLNYPGIEKQERGKVFRHDLMTFMFGALFTLLYLLVPTIHDPLGHTLIVSAMFAVLIIAVIHAIYAYVTGQTYWSAKIKAKKLARQAANSSKAELLAYAEEMKKTHG